MSTLSIQQAGDYAKQAGFTGVSLVLIVAIAEAESSLNTDAVNATDPNGGSFGVLQINGSHFGNHFGPNGSLVMSQQVAIDPAASFVFAYELSQGGLIFTDWGSFTDGHYARYVSSVATALGSSVSPLTTTQRCKHGNDCFLNVPGGCPTDSTCTQVDDNECPTSGYNLFAVSYCFPNSDPNLKNAQAASPSIGDIFRVVFDPKFLVGSFMILYAVYLVGKPVIDPVVKSGASAAKLLAA